MTDMATKSIPGKICQQVRKAVDLLTDEIVCANLDGDFELCADAVCATDQKWILVACGF